MRLPVSALHAAFLIHIVTKHKAKQKQSKANQKARRNEAKRRVEETSVILFQCFNLNYPFRSHMCLNLKEKKKKLKRRQQTQELI